MKRIVFFTALLLTLSLLAGCASSNLAEPDSISITANGEAVTLLSVVNGEEPPVLTAEVSPTDYDGEITWESSDAGVVRVAGADGNTCTLTILKSGTAKITASCGGSSAAVKITVVKNQRELTERETAYYVGDTRYSAEMMNMYYVEAYESFLAYYGDYVSYYGLDTSTGIAGLADQNYSYSSDGTWRGFFLDTACSNLLGTVALCDWAEANAYSLSQDGEAAVDQAIDELTQTAAEEGYEGLDAYLSERYGEGITTEIYREFLLEAELADEVYALYQDSLTYTDEELDEHYAEMGYEDEDNSYLSVSMRHILVFAEADEDGNYSDEAIATAHSRAEEIYAEWAAGEMTEESFAELAGQYSDDTGSVDNGGLYENIAKEEMIDEIDEWLFTDGRAVGDTAMIDYNGNYVGTHIVLFCGTGEIYSRYLARVDLMDTDITDWFEGLQEAYSVSEGADYASIGIF